MELPKNAAPMRAVSRSLAVLRAINHHGSLSMTGIARHGDVPYPTACRIVQTLLVEGLIEQEPHRKRYRPTVLVLSLAHGYSEEDEVALAARPHIHKLTKDIGWPVFVAVRAGSQMVVVDSTHSETSLSFGPCHPGFTVPLLTSGTGLTWLAHSPEVEALELVKWASLVQDEVSDIDANHWRKMLSVIRAQGYEVKSCMSGNPNRSASIAVPIVDGDTIKGVITLCYFHAAMKHSTAVERHIHPLREVAASIARDLSE